MFSVPVHFDINSDENLFLVIDITKKSIFQYWFNNKFRKKRYVKNIFANLNIITEYNASFSATKVSGQEAWKRYEFISLMVTVQIFKITDLFLRKLSSRENVEKW